MKSQDMPEFEAGEATCSPDCSHGPGFTHGTGLTIQTHGPSGFTVSGSAKPLDEAAIRADERAKVIRECVAKLLAEARRSDHDEGYPLVRARYFAEAADLIEEDGSH